MTKWCPKCAENGRKSPLIPFFDELHCNTCGHTIQKPVYQEKTLLQFSEEG